MRRLAALLAAYPDPFQALPEGWTPVLPADAPLASPQAWTQLLDRLTAANWPDGLDHGPAQGVAAAAAIGEALRRGKPLAIWRKALLVGKVSIAGLGAARISLRPSSQTNTALPTTVGGALLRSGEHGSALSLRGA
jgi:hypothetical protein